MNEKYQMEIVENIVWFNSWHCSIGILIIHNYQESFTIQIFRKKGQ